VRRSLASVGGTLAAARSALAGGGVAGNLGGGTHHGLRDEGEGYCVFNDVAVAVLALLDEGRIARAAVVDLDVHQGDGNGEILGGHPAVHILCMHGEKNFPYRKVPVAQYVPLPDGTGDAEYLALLERELPGVLAFAPDLLFYIAGADPLAEDALGRLSLTAGGLAARDRAVLRACRDASVPVAIVLGGGYASPIDLTVEVHAGTYRAAREVFGAAAPAGVGARSTRP
jgi:acetoin utilization deacetylase AcuC-like enzyme